MKLKEIKTIKGRILVVTGLHIGASNENIEIGGMDNPIIKDPLPGSNAPYIPGSSLKGKMRSLIEVKEGKFGGKNNQGPCDCGKCRICAVFGTSAGKKTDDNKDNLCPTRLIVRDAYLSEYKENTEAKSWKEKFQEGDLPMETKYENTINRITGEANPRPLERVPGGVEFDFNFSFKAFENDPDKYFSTVLQAMKLLELDALGGSGSRGCGQIKFVDVVIDGDKQKPNFLEEVNV